MPRSPGGHGGDVWRVLLDARRLERFMVTREWLEAGVPLAIGADAPGMPWHTPPMTLLVAMTPVASSGQVIGPGQRLTIREALRAHTIGAAYAAHEEASTGSIEAGRLADLTVWTEDPYTLPLPRFQTATIDLTMVGGTIVHPRAA